MPYQQPGYPPVQSPYYPQVPPPPQYAGSPTYPPSYPPSYPPTAYRSNSVGHHQSPRSDSSRGNRGRGTFTNLSWTPTTGVRGGTLLPPKSKKSADESGAEEEDNPFRPSKDLRAEDEQEEGEEREDPEVQPSKQEGNKIHFGFKKMAKRTSTSVENTPTDLAALAKLRKQERRVEKLPLKRIRPRPTMLPEFAESDSVYFRRPGNESVVGSGTYGKVFRAIHVYTGEKVALKKIRMEGERDGVSHCLFVLLVGH
jgi:CTD kinase subunit alpha